MRLKLKKENLTTDTFKKRPAGGHIGIEAGISSTAEAGAERSSSGLLPREADAETTPPKFVLDGATAKSFFIFETLATRSPPLLSPSPRTWCTSLITATSISNREIIDEMIILLLLFISYLFIYFMIDRFNSRVIYYEILHHI